MKITKTPSGRYRVQLYNELGKRIRRTFNRKSDADAYVGMIEGIKYQNRLVNNNLIQARVTFEKAFSDYWQLKVGICSRTRAKYIHELEQINIFRKNNGLTYIDEFTRDHSDSFKQILIDSGSGPKAINSYLSQLKILFSQQLKRDTILRDPTTHLMNVPLKRKTLLQREDDYYHEEEIRNFLKQEMHIQYKRAFIGLFLTGMRIEELANLKWDRIDLDKKIIQVRSTDSFTTKTPAGERDIPISNKLHTILLQIKGDTISDYLFPSIPGEKLNERTLLEVCKRIAVKANISKNATLHKFRHTFSSLLSQFGIAYEVREYLLGHKPVGSLTGHYTKFNAEKLSGTVSLLDQFVEDQ